MDSPQYERWQDEALVKEFSFKPYYKWIVLNTLDLKKDIDFMTF